MSIRAMDLDDLRHVLGWAEAEGWNPGLDDAEAFLCADPAGFLIKEQARQRVSAISVVNHSDDLAFLGLYLCHPDHRGCGHGMDVWRAGMRHAGARNIGLDGVPAQQANYARSGFVAHGKTTRYQGLPHIPRHGEVRAARADDLAAMIGADARAMGIARPSFIGSWLSGAARRKTLVVPGDTGSVAFATLRQCPEGIKIGPLHATTAAEVHAVLGEAARSFSGGPVFVDVPESAPDLAKLLSAAGFAPVFETTRMYLKPPPEADPPRFHAIATMELG